MLITRSVKNEERAVQPTGMLFVQFMNQSINQSVYYAQGSTIEHSKQNEYKMKTT